MKKIKKIREEITLYKLAIIEIMETLCSICRYLKSEGMHNHNKYAFYMESHFNKLKEYSTEMREDLLGHKERT